MGSRAFPISLLLIATIAGPLGAQLISIRTVPISQAHQFDLFPSQRAAMGGVRLAVDDSLHDPFANPAKGLRMRASGFYGSPGVYNVSNGAGAGRSLPLGAWIRSGNWFGGVSLAIQQIDLSVSSNPFPDVLSACPLCRSSTVDLPTGDPTPGNAFGYAALGVAFPSSGISLGGSFLWAGLHGVDGVDLLYPGNAALDQDGHSLDFRLGGLKEWQGDRNLSAVLVHRRFAATHDVFYLDSFWDPGTQQFGMQPRVEENLDHTNAWGLELEYSHPLPEKGWRLGYVATTNLMSHPKIPNYEIQNIPRDPGNSEAFNFGIGVSRTEQLSTLAIDLVYEPIWSYTWADAAEPVETIGGATIAAGGKTIENHFRFSNAQLRMGFSQDLPFDENTHSLGLQLGLSLHRIDYHLEQNDNVQGTTRHLQEDWLEWKPTWGLSLRFPAWEVRYRGSVTHGTGRPGVSNGDVVMAPDAPTAGTILVAPSGPLTLTGVKVMSHQVAVVFPFR